MSQALPINLKVLPSLARQAVRPKASLNRLVIGNKQRCLECMGIGNFANGRITYLMDIGKKYRHKVGCSMEGRF